ncbi:SpoIIE family protein phosphatase [Streptomyces sp. NPDC019507]|uniref:SpoIIE family protein phosphatase n=1 Tax=Streptomyces sp. NPDC019507 TaxID=3154689 RepID=UPI0033EA76E1
MAQLGPLFVVAADGLVVEWSPQAERLLGRSADEAVGRAATDLVADKESPVAFARAWGQCGAQAAGGAAELDLRVRPVVRQGGTVAWAIWLASAPEAGGAEGAGMTPALVEALFTQSPVGLVVVDTDLRIVRINTASEGMRGASVQHLLGRPFTEVLSMSDPGAVEAMIRGVLNSGMPVHDRLVKGRPPAEVRRDHIYSVSAFRLRDSGGQVRGVAASVVDVTGRERHRARASVRNAARHGIGRSLDVITTCRELVDVAVPEFADIAVVDVLDTVVRGEEPPLGPLFGNEPMRRTAFTSGRGDSPAYPVGALSRFPFPTPYTQSLNDLEPRLVTLDKTTAWLAADPERGHAIRKAGAHCLIVAPLVLRGAVLGIAGFYRSTQPEPFDADDLVLAVELAARTALCLDNARRYTREHTIALTLQRHLLPPGPTSQTAAEIAHSHGPAEAGGGWFDAIPLSSARTALIVGDVAGHGIHTATTMGQLRTAIHALAALDLDPDDLLARLNDTVIRLARERATLPPADPLRDQPVRATCVYAVYDPLTGACTLARSGHPAPVLAHPDGTTEIVDVPAGPPLGDEGAEGAPFAAARLQLDPGSILALFTNGFLGADRARGETALDRLRQVLAQPERDLGDLRDEAVYALQPAPDTGDDAILLLARTRMLTEDQVAAWTVPHRPEAVATARASAVRQLQEWGLAEDFLTTELVVSELVTNAIRHGAPPVHLRLIKNHTLTCEVSDTSPAAPHLRHARTVDEGGRGLFIVAQLTQHWGTRYTPQGKTIWTEQALSGRHERESSR